MLRLLPCLLWVLLSLGSNAHTGTETEITVHLAPGRTLLVVRCAPELAWKLLGPEAPSGPLDSAVSSAQPQLENLASQLVELRIEEKTLLPDRIRVLLEPDRHLAFALTFLQSGAPTLLSLPYLANLHPREPAILEFFDHSTSRRPAKPFARIEVQNPDRLVEFTPTSAHALIP
ncbi:hypothetical protein HNR46_003371 [Haloferula luteola]|uniref:Uncharacterized protein n=1 Tax=Haloferula luteola TaxID=595692 RepID=A0A840VEQ9_9BACT|nr:hypothetical protein [Haloferula luteola]MBB5353118.1 hypothetical protein [Haloferula luteola]